jgi:hypothetical protein
MMRLRDMPCQGKTKARAFGLACDERIEQVLVQMPRRTGARITDLNDYFIVVFGQVEPHRAAGPGGLDGIETEIENRPAQSRLVDGRGDLRMVPADHEFDTPVLRGRLDERSDIMNQSDKVAMAVRPIFTPTQRK